MTSPGVCLLCGRLKNLSVVSRGEGDGPTTGVCARCEGLRSRSTVQLAVFVPTSPDTHDIAPASAIVAWPPDPNAALIEVAYEGNTIGASNLVLFEQRLEQAAARLVFELPTRARQTLSCNELVHVGDYDARVWRIIRITNHEALEQWLGTGPTPSCVCGRGAIPCYRDTCDEGWHHVAEAHTGVVATGHRVVLQSDPRRPPTMGGAPDLSFGHRMDPDVLYVAAWGARLLVEEIRQGRSGLVWDRQSSVGPDHVVDELRALLNSGRLDAAIDVGRALLLEERLRSTSRETVTLYDDERVRIIASPRGSAGYLYVTAVLRAPSAPDSR